MKINPSAVELLPIIAIMVGACGTKSRSVESTDDSEDDGGGPLSSSDSDWRDAGVDSSDDSTCHLADLAPIAGSASMDTDRCGAQGVRICVTISNSGASVAPAGFQVAFHMSEHGDVVAIAWVVKVVPPGLDTEVCGTWGPEYKVGANLWARVDELDSVVECDEANNSLEMGPTPPCS